MHASTAFLALGLSLLPTAFGHAAITSPPIRQPGNAFLDKCGQASFNSVKGDETGHIEEQEPVTAGCELTLCRGMLFEDQPTANVQKVSPGDSMTMEVDCTIPHGGPANVSLIDTTVGGSGEVIGSFLKTFDDFCPTSGKTPADQAKTQFTLPTADVVGDKCQTAGDCVVQLFWATPDFSQNYYYCVDVAMQSSSNSTSAAATAATSAISSAAATATNAASTSAAAATTAVAASSSADASTSVETAVATATTEAVSSASATPVASDAVSSTLATETAVASTASEPALTAIPVTTAAPVAAAAGAAATSGFSTVVRVVTDTPTSQPTAAVGALAQTSSARRTRRILWFYI
ncbi:unnamed protein product [Peniophora sp. CBMAI 1063]|nr:unnamed protein product [Peniophora sp. CBMAI 1063]